MFVRLKKSSMSVICTQTIMYMFIYQSINIKEIMYIQ